MWRWTEKSKREHRYFGNSSYRKQLARVFLGWIWNYRCLEVWRKGLELGSRPLRRTSSQGGEGLASFKCVAKLILGVWGKLQSASATEANWVSGMKNLCWDNTERTGKQSCVPFAFPALQAPSGAPYWQSLTRSGWRKRFAELAWVRTEPECVWEIMT